MGVSRRQLLRSAGVSLTVGLTGVPGSGLANTTALLDPQRANHIVIGSTLAMRELNPAVQYGLSTLLPGAQIFASLLTMDRHWQLHPYLARSWQVSADGMEIDIHLHENARFHDGEPVTTADLLFSLETVRQHHPLKAVFAPIESLRILDATRATIRLSAPQPGLLKALSTPLLPILPRHVYDTGEDMRSHPKNRQPVGSGPFRLVDFDPGERVTLKRFDGFFLGNQPQAEAITFRRYENSARLLLALQRGDIDIHAQLTSAPELKKAGKLASVSIVNDAAPAIGPIVWLAFNLKHPKLADRKVRQAISYAIDKNFIEKELMAGVHGRATGPIDHSSPYYSAKVNPYDLNLERANQLLDEAGLLRGEDQIRFELTVDAIPGVAEISTLQQYLVGALKPVGIKVIARRSDGFETWARRVADHQFEASIDSVWNWGDPAIGMHRTWLGSNIRKGVLWSNTQSYRNAEVDALLNQAATELDDAKRRDLYANAQQLITDDAPVAFLSELRFHYGVNKRVRDLPDSVWGLIAPALKMRVESTDG